MSRIEKLCACVWLVGALGVASGCDQNQSVEENANSLVNGDPNRVFDAVDGSIVYFLDASHQLWRDIGSSANPQLVDTDVKDFQAMDASSVYVLRLDQNLFRDNMDYHSREPIDGNVRLFRAVTNTAFGRTVFVLGNDGKLWNERPNSGNRFPVDSNVLNFKPDPSAPDGVFVLGTDHRLWNEPRTSTGRLPVADDVSDFQPQAPYVYVLRQNKILWRAVNVLNNNSLFVDANVAAFQAITDGVVFVLGTDGNLWRERNTNDSRDQVDSGVLDFQATDYSTIYVMGQSDHKLWREMNSWQTRSPVDQWISLAHR